MRAPANASEEAHYASEKRCDTICCSRIGFPPPVVPVDLYGITIHRSIYFVFHPVRRVPVLSHYIVSWFYSLVFFPQLAFDSRYQLLYPSSIANYPPLDLFLSNHAMMQLLLSIPLPRRKNVPFIPQLLISTVFFFLPVFHRPIFGLTPMAFPLMHRFFHLLPFTIQYQE